MPNPTLGINTNKQSEAVKQMVLQDPRIKAAAASGQTGIFDLPNGWKVKVNPDGSVQGAERGSFWKPLLAAGAIFATAGLASGFLPGMAAAGAGGGSSAAAAGTGAMAGAKPLSSLLMGSLPTAIGVGGSLIGAKMQSSAANSAAQIQDRYLRDALDYTKQQDEIARKQYDAEYARRNALEDARLGRLAPYNQAGTQASNTLASLLQNAPRIPVGRATGRLSSLL